MEYRFEIRTKQTIWNSDIVYIDADSEEEAKQIMLEKIEDNDYLEEIEYSELFELLEDLTPEQNNGFSTMKVFDENEEVIFENGKQDL